MTFRTATGLSLFIHMLLFLVAGWLVDLFVQSGPGTPALVFDLVLGNVHEQGEQETQPKANSRGSKAQSTPDAVPQENHKQSDKQDLPITSNEEPHPAPIDETQPAQTENITDARETSGFNTSEDGGSEMGKAGAESILTPTTERRPLPVVLPRLPVTRTEASELIPLKLPVPPSQRKNILKKIREIVSKSITSAVFDSSFAWEKSGQRYQFSLSHRPAQSATDFDELWVTITTDDDGDTLFTRLRMQRLAFSQFAQFVDYWDPHVAVHDDEFDGRFHSNSAILISGSGGTKPKFHGKVTTADYSISNREAWPFLNSQEIFLGGIETGADHIPLPKAFLAIARDTSKGVASTTTGHLNSFAEETWLNFHRDGTYTWRSISAPEIERRAALSVEPNCIIGRGKARLHVKGVVKGMLLVYCENKIIIDGNLLYAQDPEIFPTAEDFLGLVSKKDIEIARPSVTGPGDLRICAALLAKGRFRVPHLYTRHTGTMHIYGSLSAGSISATEPRYATRVRFDKRFDKIRPPHFPMTKRYEIVHWDERWMVAPK
jgi:hypothetical protein